MAPGPREFFLSRKVPLPPPTQLAPLQGSLPVSAFIRELSNRGASFWNDPLQLVLATGSSVIVAVASGAIDALINSNRLLGKSSLKKKK